MMQLQIVVLVISTVINISTLKETVIKNWMFKIHPNGYFMESYNPRKRLLQEFLLQGDQKPGKVLIKFYLRDKVIYLHNQTCFKRMRQIKAFRCIIKDTIVFQYLATFNRNTNTSIVFQTRTSTGYWFIVWIIIKKVQLKANVSYMTK